MNHIQVFLLENPQLDPLYRHPISSPPAKKTAGLFGPAEPVLPLASG